MSRAENSGSDHSIRHFLSQVSRRAVLPHLALGILLLVAVIVLGSEIEHHITAIEAWIASLGAWGLLAFIGLFVLAASCLVPDTVLCVLAGALFDLVWGVVVASAGMLLASALQFALSRGLLRSRIERMLATRPSLAAIQRAVMGDELRLQLLLRLTPLNPATLSYVLGAVGVRFAGFALACLALLPAVMIEVYFGHAGKHIARLAGGGHETSHLHNMILIAGLAICVVVFFMISRQARRAVAEAMTKSQTEAPLGPADGESAK